MPDITLHYSSGNSDLYIYISSQDADIILVVGYPSSDGLLDLAISPSMYYIVVMVFFDSDIKKEMQKGHIPIEIVRLFHHAFQALDQTRDLNLFDIKKLVSNASIDYYRLRKGKYRAIFSIENHDFYVHAITKRSEVYKKWP